MRLRMLTSSPVWVVMWPTPSHDRNHDAGLPSHME